MKFTELPLSEAHGHLLGHSQSADGQRWSKGHQLTEKDLAEMRAAGIERLWVAILDPQDVAENDAAARLGALFKSSEITVSAPVAGRVNLFAAADGLVEIDPDAVVSLNSVDESITLATLDSGKRVTAGSLLATLKIIPYAVPAPLLTAAEALVSQTKMLTLHPFQAAQASLILSQLPATKPSLLAKAERTIRTRLERLNITLSDVQVVNHSLPDLATAIADAPSDLRLLLTASATADRQDVGPMAVVHAGGEISRFGMPVDPGNLLFLGNLGTATIIGLPGCARSPALNGADFILEHLAAGQPLEPAAINALGVGGLLKEIPSRQQPRLAAPPVDSSRNKVEILILAAGASRRMGATDKLLEKIGDQPMLRHVAGQMITSKAAKVHVVIDQGNSARISALSGVPVQRVENPRADEGMAASVRLGMRTLSADCSAVVIVLADMPNVTSAHVDRLIAAFDPAKKHEICRLTDTDGQPGHPVLFGRRFFEHLGSLSGDIGARQIVAAHPEFVADVSSDDDAARVDLDTPEDWAEWRASQASEHP